MALGTQTAIIADMNSPLTVDLPHNLGKDEARRRIEGGIGRLGDHIPGGAADIRSGWEGDVMNLDVKAMGQEAKARIDVRESLVRVEVVLPPMLSFFGKQIEKLLHKQGSQMLEDKSKKG